MDNNNYDALKTECRQDDHVVPAAA